MAPSVLFIAGCTSGDPPPSSKTVDENAEKARKAIDAQESGAPTP
jgi:hypothetical protein